MNASSSATQQHDEALMTAMIKGVKFEFNFHPKRVARKLPGNSRVTRTERMSQEDGLIKLQPHNNAGNHLFGGDVKWRANKASNPLSKGQRTIFDEPPSAGCTAQFGYEPFNAWS
uniref:Uncharacterized protein n=1 Tax=Panagrellus redivivus TaxID=6233 RepID=A0A7E4ZTH9_PANRE